MCVVSAVDTDGVFERGAVGRGEQQQLEAFCCGHAEGLSDQSKASELLGEHTACLGLQLAVKRLRRQLLSEQQHILMCTREQLMQGDTGCRVSLWARREVFKVLKSYLDDF